MTVAKQFSKKQIEKLFHEQFPNGEINLTNNDYWYCETSESKCISLRANNLYDVAEMLNLVPTDTINAMKKAAGYYSYQ